MIFQNDKKFLQRVLAVMLAVVMMLGQTVSVLAAADMAAEGQGTSASEAVEPTDTAEPTAPTDEAEPDEPTEPDEPVEPTAPTEGDDAVEPIEDDAQPDPEPEEEETLLDGVFEVVLEENITPDDEILDSLPADDELAAGFVEREIYRSLGVEDFAPFALAADSLTDLQRYFYDELRYYIKAVSSGKITSTAFKVDIPEGTSFTCTPEEIGGNVVEGQSVTAAAEAKLREKLSAIDLGSIVNALLGDLPYDLFWYDKTVGCGMSFGISGSSEEVRITYVTLYFTVASAYQHESEPYTVNTLPTTIQSALTRASNVVADYSEKTDYDKLYGYMKEICALTDYNHTAADNENTPYGDPWQLIYVFDDSTETKVVCEGYAKAFQYLCDLSTFDADIDCYSVTGYMDGGTGAGGHMWNVVDVDGSRYLVDVTNCDDNAAGSPDKLFMRCGAPDAVGGDSIKYSVYDEAGNKETVYRTLKENEQYSIAVSDSTTIVYLYDEEMSGLYCTGYPALAATAYQSGSIVAYPGGLEWDLYAIELRCVDGFTAYGDAEKTSKLPTTDYAEEGADPLLYADVSAYIGGTIYLIENETGKVYSVKVPEMVSGEITPDFSDSNVTVSEANGTITLSKDFNVDGVLYDIFLVDTYGNAVYAQYEEASWSDFGGTFYVNEPGTYVLVAYRMAVEPNEALGTPAYFAWISKEYAVTFKTVPGTEFTGDLNWNYSECYLPAADIAGYTPYTDISLTREIEDFYNIDIPSDTEEEGWISIEILDVGRYIGRRIFLKENVEENPAVFYIDVPDYIGYPPDFASSDIVITMSDDKQSAVIEIGNLGDTNGLSLEYRLWSLNTVGGREEYTALSEWQDSNKFTVDRNGEYEVDIRLKAGTDLFASWSISARCKVAGIADAGEYTGSIEWDYENRLMQLPAGMAAYGDRACTDMLPCYEEWADVGRYINGIVFLKATDPAADATVWQVAVPDAAGSITDNTKVSVTQANGVITVAIVPDWAGEKKLQYLAVTEGYETEWQDGNELRVRKAGWYDVIVRFPATENAFVSDDFWVGTIYVDKSGMEEFSHTIEWDYKNETLPAGLSSIEDLGYTLYGNSDLISERLDAGSSITDYIGKEIYATNGDGNIYYITVPARPEAPVDISVSTLYMAFELGESFDSETMESQLAGDSAWSSDNKLYVDGEGEYTLFVRYKATDNAFASEVIEVCNLVPETEPVWFDRMSDFFYIRDDVEAFSDDNNPASQIVAGVIEDYIGKTIYVRAVGSPKPLEPYCLNVNRPAAPTDEQIKDRVSVWADEENIRVSGEGFEFVERDPDTEKPVGGWNYGTLTLSDLKRGSWHTILVRFSATETAFASWEYKLSVCTTLVPTIEDVFEFNVTNETITVRENIFFEFKDTAGENIGKGEISDGKTPIAIPAEAVAVVLWGMDMNGDYVTENAKTINIVRQTAPALPEDDKGYATATAVTAPAIAGAEYSIDGGETWQTSNVFTAGIESNQTYTVLVRMAGQVGGGNTISDAVFPSAAVEVGPYTTTTNYDFTAPTVEAVEYGTPLSDIKLVGGVVTVKGSDEEVKGTWNWDVTNSTEVYPTAVDTDAYGVVFTPADTDTYKELRASVTPSVTVRTVSVTVTADDRVYGAENDISYSFDKNTLVGDDVLEIYLSTEADAASKVGKYEVAVDGWSNPNYNVKAEDVTFNVTARPITVTVADKTVTYGEGVPAEFDVKFEDNFANGEDETTLGINFEFEKNGNHVSKEDARNAGTYTVTPISANTNYKINAVKGELTVNKLSISVKVNDKAITYGDAVPDAEDFTASVTSGGYAYGEDITALNLAFAYDNGVTVKNAGIYNVNVTGISTNYEIEGLPGTLTIEKRPVTVKADDKSITYGSTAPALTFTLTEGAVVSGDTEANLGVTLKADEFKGNAGEYTITEGGVTEGNYDVTVQNGTLTVNPKEITVTVSDKETVYGQSALPVFTATVEGLASGDTESVLKLDFVPDRAVKDAGTYIMTPVSENENYTIKAVTGTLTVKQLPITVTMTNPTVTYGDKITEPEAEITSGYLAYEDKLDALRLDIKPDKTVGGAGVYTYSSEVPTDTNYDITFVSGKLTIEKRDITVEVIDKEIAYGDTVPTKFDVSVTGSFASGEDVTTLGLTFAFDETEVKNAGEYTVTPSAANANYNVTCESGTLTIAKRAVTFTIDSHSREFGKANPALTYKLTTGEIVSGDTIEIAPTTEAKADSPVVEAGYAITATVPTGGAYDNYDIKVVDGILRVVLAEIKVNILSKEMTYGGDVPTFEAEFAGEYDITGGITALGLVLGTDVTSESDVGKYPITLKDYTNKNYSVIVEKSGTLTVNKRPLTLKVADAGRTYGNDNGEFTYSAPSDGIVNGDSITIVPTTTADKSSSVGTYDITAAAPTDGDAKNYEITVVKGTLTVNKRSVTVTVDNKEMVYGDNVPELTATASDMANGDGIAVLNLDITTTASSTSDVNEEGYAIEAAVKTEPTNYTVTAITNGKLTVTPRAATAKANDAERLYFEDEPEFTVTVIGAVNGDELTFTPTTNAQKTDNAGNYNIIPGTAGGEKAKNYTVAYENGTLTVKKRTITIDIADAKAVYGQAIPTFTASADGMVNSEKIGDTGLELNIATETANPKDAGTYTIKATEPDWKNYVVSGITTGTLTISPKPINITLGNKEMVYGAAVPTLDDSIAEVDEATLAYGETKSVLKLVLSTTATSESNAGTYPITATSANGNYEVKFTNGTLTVDKAKMTEVVTKEPTYTIRADSAENTEAAILAKLPAKVEVKLDNGKTEEFALNHPDTVSGFAKKGGKTYTLGSTFTGSNNIDVNGQSFKVTVIVETVTGTLNTYADTAVRIGFGEGSATAAELIAAGKLPETDKFVVTGDSGSTEVSYRITWAESTLDTASADAVGVTFSGTAALVDAPDWLTAPSTMAVTRKVTVVDKDEATVTVTQADGTYGTALAAPTAAAEFDGAALTGGEFTYMYSGTSYDGTETLTNSASAPTRAGSYIVTAKYEDADYVGVSAAVSFTVAPKAIAIASVSAADREYNETAVFDVTSAVLDGVINSDDVSAAVTGVKATVSGTMPGSYSSAVITGDITLSGGHKANYTLTQPASAVAVSPAVKIELAAASAPAANEGYGFDYTAETIKVLDGYGVNTAADGSGETVVNGASVTERIGTALYIRKDETATHEASAYVSLTVPARPEAPTGIAAVAETVLDKDDGKLTGLTTAMQYSINGGAWQTAAGDLTDLAAGTKIKVRLAATESAFASTETAEFTIDGGHGLTVYFVNGDTAISDWTQTGIAYNGKATEPTGTITKQGYKLLGWTLTNDGSDYWNFNTNVQADITLYAKWEQIAFPVSLNVSDADNNALTNATVHLTNGFNELTTTYNSSMGKYIFEWIEPGDYNMNVEAVIDGSERSVTVAVTVPAHSYEFGTVKFPAENVSSFVDIDKSHTLPEAPRVEMEGVVIDGVTDEAISNEVDGSHVDTVVTLVVKAINELSEAVNDAKEKFVAAVTAEKAEKLIFLDLSIKTKVGEAAEQEKSEAAGNLQLKLDLGSSEIVSGKRFMVYRYTVDETTPETTPDPTPVGPKGAKFASRALMARAAAAQGSVDILTETPNADGEYIEVDGGGVVTIYAKKAGVYALDFEVVAPEQPAPDDGDDDSDYRDFESDFWDEVEEAAKQAERGSVLRVNARGYDRMPRSLMQYLCDNPYITLEIAWNGGETIVIPAGAALSPADGRIYYPLSYLAGLTFTKPNVINNPSTGMVVELAAPAVGELTEELLGESITDATSGMTDAAPAENVTAPIIPEMPAATENTSGSMGLIAAAAALAAACACVFAVLRRRKA